MAVSRDDTWAVFDVLMLALSAVCSLGLWIMYSTYVPGFAAMFEDLGSAELGITGKLLTLPTLLIPGAHGSLVALAAVLRTVIDVRIGRFALWVALATGILVPAGTLALLYLPILSLAQNIR